MSMVSSRGSRFSGGISLLLLLRTKVFAWNMKGKKNTGPSAASEMNLITSTSFQRAPVVTLQVYSSPGECQTKAPLSFSVPVKQLFYFSELHLLGGSHDYHNTGAGFGRDASPSTLQQAGASGW